MGCGVLAGGRGETITVGLVFSGGVHAAEVCGLSEYGLQNTTPSCQHCLRAAQSRMVYCLLCGLARLEFGVKQQNGWPRPFGAGMKGRGDGRSRESLPTGYIVRHDSHMRKSGSDPAGNRARFAQLSGASQRCRLISARRGRLPTRDTDTSPRCGGELVSIVDWRAAVTRSVEVGAFPRSLAPCLLPASRGDRYRWRVETCGRPTARQDVCVAVERSLLQSHNKSLLQRASELVIPKTTMLRHMEKDLGLKSFRPIAVNELSNADMNKLHLACARLLESALNNFMPAHHIQDYSAEMFTPNIFRTAEATAVIRGLYDVASTSGEARRYWLCRPACPRRGTVDAFRDGWRPIRLRRSITGESDPSSASLRNVHPPRISVCLLFAFSLICELSCHSDICARSLQCPQETLRVHLPYTKKVAERLACSPPTNVNRVQYPVGSFRIFANGYPTGQCR
ncbi:hypothetical protein PR048_015976 [Dryococelus australis]|uniref:Uncharacterized protein n=1 Tax=Dryococelus australis TaxID=614101 RepID=A0ABQ9HIH9_9NEOP|nr:hypothetical protein PR048_015976 [Dryococelus australis]